MLYWLRTFFKVGPGCTRLLLTMVYRSGDYNRFLFRERSWSLDVNPAPLPEFVFDDCSGGWRLRLGWFTLWIVKPGMMH
jgi:hypothetical protein